MPQLDLVKTYRDGETPSAGDVDGIRLPLETFLNITKIDSTNIQASAVTTALLAPDAVTSDKIAAANVTRAKLAAANYQISSSSSNFEATFGPEVSVTNLSVTITTVGRPVLLALISANNSSRPSKIGITGVVDSSFFLQIYRDASVVSSSAFIQGNGGVSAVQAMFVPCSAVFHIDSVAAGTYTYTVKISDITGAGATVHIYDCKLLAMELM